MIIKDLFNYDILNPRAIVIKENIEQFRFKKDTKDETLILIFGLGILLTAYLLNNNIKHNERKKEKYKY